MNLPTILESIDLSKINLGLAIRMANEPWIMEERAFAEMVGFGLSAAMNGSLNLSAETSPKLDEKTGFGTPVQADDDLGIAIMSIRGIISPYRMHDEEPGDRTNPHAIRHDAARLRADDSVDTVIMDIDSPGGTSSGLDLAVDELRLLAQEKRLVAWNNDLMASAAYWLGAAADEIYAAPSADSGSIGVYIAPSFFFFLSPTSPVSWKTSSASR